MRKKEKTNKKKNLKEASDGQIEAYKVRVPFAVAAKDESKDEMLKKLECED